MLTSPEDNFPLKSHSMNHSQSMEVVRALPGTTWNRTENKIHAYRSRAIEPFSMISYRSGYILPGPEPS